MTSSNAINENINFKEYSVRVLKNESVVSECHYDVERLKRAMELVALSNQILNQVKRELFYQKSDLEKYDKLNNDLKNALEKPRVENNQALEKLINLRVLHAALGLNTESAEILEVLPDVLDGTPLDEVNMNEELGDVFWYQAVLIDALKLDLNNTLEVNALKLEKRYKNKGFAFTAAVDRNLDAERKILEAGHTNKAETELNIENNLINPSVKVLEKKWNDIPESSIGKETDVI